MKLIRDKLDQVISQDRLTIVEGDEFDDYLKQKLTEEIQELIDSDYKDLSEYADVIEVLHAMVARFTDKTMSDVENVRQTKSDERGGFYRGLVFNPNVL
ncbi:MAG: nucleoside triphosphate pyrophosphohydrolase [Neptunomonas phycophila]|uniref:nucleoside triphosphate pyrophosphohydrolase n=1 Tax=Neptunomonas phycophila TaxID=1572645 RepID=UPI003B8B527B